MQGADFFTALAREFYPIVNRSVSGTPPDQKNVASFITVNFWHRNFFSQLSQFIAALRRHRHVQLWIARRMAHLVVLKTGQ